MGAERMRIDGFGRLENGLRQASDWYLWGPYVSERQWGTVREDYSANGDAWDDFPHDHARSRAYRWGEDGLAGFCDVEQRLCIGLALWNGKDPILKERIFGLTGPQGNHGEDAKEYWWHRDALPSHAWNQWRYHYPQKAFPYHDLVAENGRRGRFDLEYELLDTGAFDDDRYWIVEMDYAKADPTDLLITVRITNAAAEPASLQVLPTVWFRNTWSWEVDAVAPALRARKDGVVEIDHPFLGQLELITGPGPDQAAPELLFCDNETNTQRLYGSPGPRYPKDGINDHVVDGAPSVNPDRSGTKAAARYHLSVDPGATVELRLRLRPRTTSRNRDSQALGTDFTRIRTRRQVEADEFYQELTPPDATTAEAAVMRAAFAGMLWSKQFYYFDVKRWLAGDPNQPRPPAERSHGRNSKWRNFNSFDIMSMPDSWEYPWFAAWDMAFHCVTLAHIDPAFAKYQLTLLCREWFQHPNGALPAYEWSFDDVNPPVQAWAALEVFTIDGAKDIAFLERIFSKMLINFTWWVNRQGAGETDLFKGGFLGLDNIGPLDRSNLPVQGSLAQSDATAWMAFYALSMAAIATVLRRAGRPTEDLLIKFLEHFALISRALDESGMWDADDGFYYDRLTVPDGTAQSIKVRSMVGVLPMLASVVLDDRAIEGTQRLGKQFAHLLGDRMPDNDELAGRQLLRVVNGERRLLLGVVDIERVLRIFGRLFDESEFLSAHGLRALSRAHRDQPYELTIEGTRAVIDYEPAESTTSMFGGNSNWRGPVWMPLNHLLISAVQRYARFLGDDYLIEYPTGSGKKLNLAEVAEDLRHRVISLFVPDESGARPCFGEVGRMQNDPAWKDLLLFHEYFHADTGAGLGASHQTGWTAGVADLIRRSPGSDVPTLANLLTYGAPDD